MKKSLLTISLMVAVVCGMLLTNGCMIGVGAAAGAGQSGVQAANNYLVGKGAGDHSTGTGTGFSEKDNLPSLVESMKRKPADTRK